VGDSVLALVDFFFFFILLGLLVGAMDFVVVSGEGVGAAERLSGCARACAPREERREI